MSITCKNVLKVTQEDIKALPIRDFIAVTSEVSNFFARYFGRTNPIKSKRKIAVSLHDYAGAEFWMWLPIKELNLWIDDIAEINEKSL